MSEIHLSERLLAIAGLAEEAERLADIGTDHAHIPIALALRGRLKHAIAMDINRGPLLRAEENIALFGLSEKIETRLSDGAEALLPGEADTVVIAGMGGALMVRILTDGASQLAQTETLVLQPQSELSEFRKKLHALGYRVLKEDMVFEDGKYYPMMKVTHGKEEAWSETEYCYGRELIRTKHPVLSDYLQKERANYESILAGLQKRLTVEEEDSAAYVRIKHRSEEIEEALKLNRMAEEEMQ
ncbi:MAG: class I SAM-dependent methyltransferase [Eubacteriales bacterium]|nr:class I SAM-dependent methyltransferase [Eubacteriales bacterium]